MDTDGGTEVVTINILHGVDHANFISDASNVWKQVTDFHSRFAIFSKLPAGAFIEVARALLLIMPLVENGFVIKGINV